MMGGFDGMTGGWGGLGLAGMLLNFLLLAGLLAAIAWVVVKILPTQGAGARPLGARTDPAEEVLRGRFARGEISAEEYERSLRTLRGEPPRNYEDYVREATQQQATVKPPARASSQGEPAETTELPQGLPSDNRGKEL